MRPQLFDPRNVDDTRIPLHKCYICERLFREDEIKLFVFSDNEKMKICDYCDIDDCGEVDGIYPVDEPDDFTDYINYYIDERD